MEHGGLLTAATLFCPTPALPNSQSMAQLQPIAFSNHYLLFFLGWKRPPLSALAEQKYNFPAQ